MSRGLLEFSESGVKKSGKYKTCPMFDLILFFLL